MKSTLIVLARLQEVESRLRASESDKDRATARYRELQQEVDKLQAEFKTAHTKVDELEREKRLKDGEYQMERDKLRKWEGRLEELRNSREFAALQREVEATRRANQDIQERILALMGQIEEATKAMKAVGDTLGQAEKATADEAEASRARVADLDAAAVRHREERKRLAGSLSAPVLKRFEQILLKRAGLAVVEAVDGVCKGCNMGVPPQIFIKVQRGESMETCQRCSRILFHGSMLEPPAASDGAPVTAV